MVSNERYKGVIKYYLERIDVSNGFFECNVIMDEMMNGWVDCPKCNNKCNGFYIRSRLSKLEYYRDVTTGDSDFDIILVVK